MRAELPKRSQRRVAATPTSRLGDNENCCCSPLDSGAQAEPSSGVIGAAKEAQSVQDGDIPSMKSCIFLSGLFQHFKASKARDFEPYNYTGATHAN